jgi:large conductance mechanosensitive channel
MAADNFLHKTEGFAMNWWAEFRDFAFKGNMIDLAVAVVIGGAFGKIVQAIVTDIITPLIAMVTPGTGALEDKKFHGFLWGDLINNVINFLIIALVIFVVIVKLIGSMISKAKPAPAASEPTTKECPLCLSVIPIKAIKCAHCTSDLPAAV